MTDGLSLARLDFPGESRDIPCPPKEPPITLHNFSLWIELQPLDTIIGLLDLLGNDLYRREQWAAGNDVKDVVRNLRGME